MQATMNSSALTPSLRLQFARRGYMVRSEKRRRPESQQSSGQGSNRPPRKRRPRAGFFYKLLMGILLLTLWPFGLIMLWNRRLRWGALTKAFTSIITLMACILLVGTALTVQIDHPTFRAAQEKVNGALDVAADSLIDFGVRIGERAEDSMAVLRELNLLYGQKGLNQIADVIDRGVEIAQDLRERADGLFAGSTDATEPDVDAGETPAPAESDPEAEADGADAKEDGAPAPTSVPAADILINDETEELPIYIPGAASEYEPGAAIFGGMLSRSGLLEAQALPTAAPEPTPEILTFAVKPAGEAIVYFNIGSGRYYHMTTVCGSMKNADTHTFAETAENIHEPCERCAPPAKALLNETYIVWLDAGNTAHLTDECENFEGQWNIISAAEANEAEYEGCAGCRADLYLAALKEGKTVTLDGSAPEATAEPTSEATSEPTPEPTSAPTPEPSPQVVTPSATLKPAGEAVVYHSSNGKYYHMNDHCSGMTGGKTYTLAECVEGDYQQCNACSAPSPASLEMECLWQDGNTVCHVSDECEYFVGVYALISRDEALADGLSGCPHCGAADYLIPNTVTDAYYKSENVV